VNKLFKSYLKKKYIKFQIVHLNLFKNINLNNSNSIYSNVVNTKSEVKEDDIIEWINTVWNDSNLITNTILFNSLKYCGITNKLDGSEDELFRWPSDNKEHSMV
jgi:hypothetical protein